MDDTNNNYEKYHLLHNIIGCNISFHSCFISITTPSPSISSRSLYSNNSSSTVFTSNGCPTIPSLKQFEIFYSTIHAYLACTVCLFGTGTNLLNSIILTQEQMRNPTNTLLTGIAIVDSLTVLAYGLQVIYLHFITSPYPDKYPHSQLAVYLILINHAISIGSHTISTCLLVQLAAFRCWVLYSRKLKYLLSSHHHLTWIMISSQGRFIIYCYISAGIIGCLLCMPTFILYQCELIDVRNASVTLKTKEYEGLGNTNNNFNDDDNNNIKIINVETNTTINNDSTITTNSLRPITCNNPSNSTVMTRNSDLNNSDYINDLRIRSHQHRINTNITTSNINLLSTVTTTTTRNPLFLQISSLAPSNELRNNELNNSSSRNSNNNNNNNLMITRNRRHSSRLLQKSRESQHVTIMLIIIVISFVITEAPQGVFNALVAIKGECFLHTIYLPLGDLLDLLVLLNSSTNFILYCAMSQVFRVNFVNLLKKLLLFTL
ncbi:putative neuropeptide F-like receptor [Schistosoma mansoni]|uniref:putative neuropeptide F-like receptor n=1 Tax=Schistosoma mansoni TaxID=6183 RepID=UPI00022DC169|nr:putative neuropeptide F-like receptor [Schistosoma mansoni]|eukprot:XP_018650114.1 putative neuropeptide F-like receptor [Schistosoma mansoni]